MSVSRPNKVDTDGGHAPWSSPPLGSWHGLVSLARRNQAVFFFACAAVRFAAHRRFMASASFRRPAALSPAFFVAAFFAVFA